MALLAEPTEFFFGTQGQPARQFTLRVELFPPVAEESVINAQVHGDFAIRQTLLQYIFSAASLNSRLNVRRSIGASFLADHSDIK